MIFARFFHGGFVISKTEFARLIPLQAGQHDVGGQRIIARVFAKLHGGLQIAAGDQVFELIHRRLGHQPLLANRQGVLNNECHGDNRHQDDDDADVAAGLNRIQKSAVLENRFGGPAGG